MVFNQVLKRAPIFKTSYLEKKTYNQMKKRQISLEAEFLIYYHLILKNLGVVISALDNCLVIWNPPPYVCVY